MTIFITLISIILFIILIALIWNRLSDLEPNQKILTCIASLSICIVFTLIIFSISSNGIEYINKEQKSIITRTFVAIFAPINGIIFIPYLAKIRSEAQCGNIDKKQTKRTLIILLILLILGTIIQINYFKTIQLGIIDYSN